MKDKQYDVVIIGGGLAGMSAAKVLLGLGLKTLIVEETSRLGGQYIRQQANGNHLAGPSEAVKKQGLHLTKEIAQGSDLMLGAKVIGIFDGREMLIEDQQGKVHQLTADAILLATGARERFLPFKGWTLPGVVSLGASQIMMKSSGIIPSENVVVAGAGPLLYVLAAQILRNGGDVPLLIDRASMIDKMQILTTLPPQWSKLSLGMQDMLQLVMKRTTQRHQHAVVAARGDGRLEEIVYAKLDQHGKPIIGSEHSVATDCLAIGHGFVANTELAANAGCDLVYQPQKGGWLVATNAQLMTSQEGIFAAGELTSIGGNEQSLYEGELAGLSIATHLGKESRFTESRTRELQAYRQKQLGFNRFISKISHIPSACWASISDETILCRCEDVTMGELRRVMSLGLDSSSLIKRGTRAGMGRCQGRTCSPILNDFLQSQQVGSVVKAPSIRFPVKPVRLSSLEATSDE